MIAIARGFYGFLAFVTGELLDEARKVAESRRR